MPSKPTRQQAREQINSAFQAALSKVIPADESQPLRGRTFSDFEDQVEEASRIVAIEMLQRRAELDAMAWEENPGLCPHCDSDRVYLEKQTTAREFRSPAGLVKIRVQNCRCRACNGSFSPSAPRLAASQRSVADASRAAARVPRKRRAAL
jgi:hypothetical protein